MPIGQRASLAPDDAQPDEAQHEADAVEAEQDAALGEAELFQPVVKVLVVRVKKRVAAQAAPEHGEGRVENRHARAR